MLKDAGGLDFSTLAQFQQAMGEDEGLALQNELREQIEEQRASLRMVKDANDAVPSDELSQMLADLVASIHTMESSLAQLSATTGANTVLHTAAPNPGTFPESQGNQHDQNAFWELNVDRSMRSAAARKVIDLEAPNKPEAPLEFDSCREKAAPEEAGFSGREIVEWAGFKLGNRCRFRGQDRRWHNGVILEFRHPQSVNGSPSRRSTVGALVAYLTPTTVQTKLCSFFAQRRCRFGDDCRSFHGFSVRAHRLRPYQPPDPGTLLPGERVLALRNDTGLWEPAEIEKIEGAGETVGLQIAFVRDGKRASAGFEAIESPSVPTPEGASSDSDSEAGVSGSAGDADLSGDEEESPRGGLGDSETSAGVTSRGVDCRADAALMTSAGIQGEVRLLAGWEEHTRGVASKMMASMGFVAGRGLGRDNQGMVNPLPVKVLPKNASLDFVGGEQNGEKEGGRKKSRGGEKSRKRKAAQAARVARAEDGSEDDMFSLINKQLAAPPAAALGKTAEHTRKVKSGSSAGSDRQKLLAQGEDVEELRKRIAKLQEMADRNRKDRTVSAAVQRKLEETRNALATAEAAHESAHREIHEKERHKKLLKW
ncbi:CCCH-type zinc finger protein [Klebsormidium nitens]|uniref:CCCH-type zinc finger protein n=1 Tax=Klebsormidium nitens TaxID=105231 RepID=A0A1Y1HJT3_KLENI|nr:CCCH-type zinc finger protein [Klebsormidium nitens]|eukprot:GAQ78800.1 CCCH-type zinc finger protein [Klebsormidium nitens]